MPWDLSCHPRNHFDPVILFSSSLIPIFITALASPELLWCCESQECQSSCLLSPTVWHRKNPSLGKPLVKTPKPVKGGLLFFSALTACRGSSWSDPQQLIPLKLKVACHSHWSSDPCAIELRSPPYTSYYLNTKVYSSAIHKSQNVEAVQMSINMWMAKQSRLCPTVRYYSTLQRNEVLFQAW